VAQLVGTARGHKVGRQVCKGDAPFTVVDAARSKIDAIRAELNGEQGARDAGRLRQEGKDYVVQDGDVMLFRFNV